MPIDLRSPTPQLLASVTRDLAANGMAAVRDVRLPDCFEPAMTDVVFLTVDGNLEIYISAVNKYRGSTPAWLEIMARPRWQDPGRRIASPGSPGSKPWRQRVRICAAGHE